MPVCKLRSINDIETIKNKITIFDRPASFRVELLCPNTLDSDRQRILERRLAFCLSDCGCAFASIGMILIPLLMFIVGNYSLLPIWPNTVIYVLSTLTGSLLAKVCSLIVSYHLAHRIIAEFISSLTDADRRLSELSDIT